MIKPSGNWQGPTSYSALSNTTRARPAVACRASIRLAAIGQTFNISYNGEMDWGQVSILFAVAGFAAIVLSWSVEGLGAPATAHRPDGRQRNGSPLGAGNLLRDLGFGDLGLELLQQACSLRLKAASEWL